MNLFSGSDKDIKLKEKLNPEQLKAFLKLWIAALDEGKDLDITIEGKTCHVPKDAFESGKTIAEYEFEDGEGELEIELKWKQ